MAESIHQYRLYRLTRQDSAGGFTVAPRTQTRPTRTSWGELIQRGTSVLSLSSAGLVDSLGALGGVLLAVDVTEVSSQVIEKIVLVVGIEFRC